MIDWSETKTIEVGAADKLLRLWKAKEAVRHAELRLASQLANRVAIEARATSLFGWAIPIGLASVTVALGDNREAEIIRAAWASAACCIVAGCGAAWTLWPRAWNLSGQNPHGLISSKQESELVVLESIAIQYTTGIRSNSRQLLRLAFGLRVTWLALGFAPIAAAVLGAGGAVVSDLVEWLSAWVNPGSL